MFSKACEYGIRATIYITQQSLLGNKVNLIDVSDVIESPPAYTSKILQKLSRQNIIISEKGPTGGFSINITETENIKLSSIVFAIDGDSIYNGCALGLKHCNEDKPCPVHNQFKMIRDDLKNMLESTTIISLTADFEKGFTFLKR